MSQLPIKYRFKPIGNLLLNKIKEANPNFNENYLFDNLSFVKSDDNKFSLNWDSVNYRFRNPVDEITTSNLNLSSLLTRLGFASNVFTVDQKDELLSKIPDGLKSLYLENTKSIHIEPDINKLYKPFTLTSLSDITTQCLLANETVTIKLKTKKVNPYYPFRPVLKSEISVPANLAAQQKQPVANITVSDMGDITAADTGNGYKIITFPESAKEIRFKLSRSYSWLTFSEFVEGNNVYLYTVGILNNSPFTGRIVRFRKGGFDILSNTPSNDEIINKPFDKVIPVGTIFRVKIENDGRVLNIYLTKPNASETHWLSIKRSDPRFNRQNPNHVFNKIGFCLGVSGGETADNGTKTLYQREIMFKEEGNQWVPPNLGSSDNESTVEKYAILVTGGQSNMVGYDESLIDMNDYPVDDRLVQWGIYGTDKNNIIHLGPHAHAYQDMRPYSNLSNSTPNLGTKGIHYPLAKLMKDALKQIPKDYKILVINGAFGSTWFGANDGVAGLDSTGYLPRSLGSGAKWGVNSSYYLSIKKRIQKIFEDYPASKLIGFVWCQGEHENVRNYDGYVAMRNDFINYVNTIDEDRRFIKDANKSMIFMDSCSKWKKIADYNRYMDMIKTNVHNNGTFVEIPITTDTNLVNGTSRTTRDREAHFGNNAYKEVIAPLVFNCFKNIIDNQQ